MSDEDQKTSSSRSSNWSNDRSPSSGNTNSPESTESSGKDGDSNEQTSKSFESSNGKKSKTYLEKRRKNNEAAKRSREKRRKQELHLEQRVMELKEENDNFIRELMRAQIIHREVIRGSLLRSELGRGGPVAADLIPSPSIHESGNDNGELNNSNYLAWSWSNPSTSAFGEAMTLFHAVFQQNQSSLLSEENFHGMRRRMVDEFSANFSSASPHSSTS